MARQSKTIKQPRKRYSAEYKAEALALAATVGNKAAALQLGLHESQIYNWRASTRATQERGETEIQQATEIARLKRQLAEQTEELAILKKAAAYFAKNQK